MKEKLKRVYDSQITLIPKCNREYYRIVWCSYRLWIFAYPDQYRELTGRLLAEIQRLQNPAMCHVPPGLLRYPGETSADYINRCYVAGDYHVIH